MIKLPRNYFEMATANLENGFYIINLRMAKVDIPPEILERQRNINLSLLGVLIKAQRQLIKEQKNRKERVDKILETRKEVELTGRIYERRPEIKSGLETK